MAIEPHLNDPDWGRYLMQSSDKLTPSGDPTKWGGVDKQPPLVIGSPARVVTSPTIVAAACRDNYARNWSIFGQLRLGFTTWGGVGGYPTPPNDRMNVYLECTFGVGQVQFVHKILLHSGPTLGLCDVQNAANGGVFGEFVDPPGIARPFAAVGAGFGNTLSVRAIYDMGAITLFVAEPAIVVAVCPHAAGEGL